MGERLMTLPRRDEDIFVRPKIDRKAIQNSILTPMELESLTDVMVDLLKREKRKYTVVKRDRLSIKEKLIELKMNLKVGTQTTMDKLIHWEKGKEEVVITFISLLELARLDKLDIFQNEQDGSIYIDVKNSLDSFDVETADGFEPEDEDDSVTAEDLVAVAPELEAPVVSVNAVEVEQPVIQ
jgi:segregation and condensation protein A